MNEDELMNMFGLDAPLPDDPGDVDLEAPTPADADMRQPTVVICDQWALRRGVDLSRTPRWEATGLNEHDAADFHALCFDPRAELQPCSDRVRERFIRALVETPEFGALHDTTILDDINSQLAALNLGDEYAKYKAEHKDEPAANLADEMGAEIAALKAASRGMEKAGEEVREADNVRGMMGSPATGYGDGCAVGPMDARSLAALFEKVKGNPKLRRICELAGRFRLMAASKQRTKQVHGMDDMVGVELSGDLGRVLPHELVKLDIEELELDMLRRLAERQAMSREYASVEAEGKGPIIVTVDESSSMNGTPIETAKALALTMGWIAKQQGRWCCLVAYTGAVRTGSNERVLVLPPGRWNDKAVIDWLIPFMGYGSDIDVPVRELPRIYADAKPPRGQTDVIMITDASCSLSPDIEARFNAWKKAERVKVITLLVSQFSGSDGYSLNNVSDELHKVATLSTGEIAVGRVLAL